MTPGKKTGRVYCYNAKPARGFKYKINVKNCSLSTTYNGDMTHRKQQK